MSRSISAGFLTKVIGAFALVMLADRLFWVEQGLGSNLGIFAAGWLLVTLALIPAIRRDRRALAALGLAAALALVIGDDPSWLGWSLFWVALAVAALLPREARFGSAVEWLYRLLIHALTSVIGPWRDLSRLKRATRHGGTGSLRTVVPLLPLPLAGVAIFLALFANANPLIGDALARLELPGLNVLTIVRSLFWLAALTAVWATLRPARVRLAPLLAAEGPPMRLPGVSVGSVTLSLVAFNALFGLQNALDVAFLWSGASLPDGATLASYAHRGAYPLIATALLAGLFVLVTLRPGSETAAVPLIRRLVVAWVFQNVFLVASSILRTLDYIDAYSLTRLRIGALVWMGLVAAGLLLILWRMLAGKSATWLINANTAVAGVVLIAASAVDLGSVAASWNVRHAREVGGRGAALDLCYLNELGPSALVSLTELQHRPGLPLVLFERVARVQADMHQRTIDRQRGGSWTWRDARRLAQVERVATLMPVDASRVPFGKWSHGCDGRLTPPPPIIAVPEGETTPGEPQPPTVATPAPPAVPAPALTPEPRR